MPSRIVGTAFHYMCAGELNVRFGILLSATAGMALLVAAPAAATSFTPAQVLQASAALQAMRELNLIVLGDLTSGAEVEGKAFVGGSVSGSNENFGIGSSAHPGQGFAVNSRATLTVGGNVGADIHINNGLNGSTGTSTSSGLASVADVGGNVTGTVGVNVSPAAIRVGGSFNNQNFNPAADRTATYGTTASNLQAQDAPFVVHDAGLAAAQTGLAATIAGQTATLTADLTQLSTMFSSLTANAAFNTSDHNNIFVTYDPTAIATGYAVIDVNASDLMGYSGTLNFNLLSSGGNPLTTIVNVIGSGNYNFALNVNNAALDQNVIWNFASANSLTTQTEFYGSVLAPTTILNNKNAIDGSVVARTFFQQGEVHLGTFAGYGGFFETTTGGGTGGVPEPASWALMLLGFGATGSLIRRQRRKERLAAA